MARHPIYAGPRPLILHDQKLILSWSAKSGSVQILLWYLIQSGLLEAAKAHSPWVHNYRIDVIHASDAYQAWTRQIIDQGVADYTLVKYWRDPMERCVSTFRHALRSGYADAHMEQVLGRPANHKVGFSFRQFLDYLNAIDLRRADLHHKVQCNEIDGLNFGRKISVRVDNSSLYQSLNRLEQEFHLKPTDFDKINDFKIWADLHHAEDASQSISSEDLFERKLTKLDAERQWPKTLLGTCDAACDGVQDIYRPDYTAMNQTPDYLPAAQTSRSEHKGRNSPAGFRGKLAPRRFVRSSKKKFTDLRDAMLVTTRQAPRRSIFYYHRANALISQDQYGKAVEFLNKAITSDPDIAEYHVRLAEYLRHSSRPGEAMAAMETAVKLEPLNGALQYEMGLLYADNQKLEQANAALNEAIRLYPKYGLFHHQAARVLNSMGRLKDAIRASRQAVGLTPGAAQFHHFLGNLLLQDKQYSKALPVHATAIGIEPGRAAYHNSLSRDLGGLGRFDEAIKSARQAVGLEPDKAAWQANLDYLLRAANGP